jgi:hypothetical protein
MLGMDRRYAHQSQAPYTSPDCQNERPSASIEGRDRGGSRPGLGKAFALQLGSAGNREIRMLATVSNVQADGFKVWSDDFTSTALGDVWTAAAWVGTAPSLIDDGFTQVAYNDDVGAVRDDVSDLDTGQDYVVSIDISPYQASHHGSYTLYARMTGNAGSGTPTDGVIGTLTMDDGTGDYAGNLKVYAGGAVSNTYAFTGGSDGSAAYGTFSMLISGDDITCYWRGTTVLAAQTVTTQAGTRVGFGANCTVAGGICLVDNYRIEYYGSAGEETMRNRLIASAGGKLYRSTWSGTLEEVSTSLTLASDRHLHAVEYLQKLYIADVGDPAVDTTGVTVAGTDLSKGGVNWTTAGCDANDMVAVLTNAAGGAVDGTYTIASVGSTTLALDSSAGTGTASVRVERGPKVYDPSDNTLAIWSASADSGAVPTGRPYIERYQDCLFMAGGLESPQTWTCSRQGDPLDWLDTLDESDVARPIAGQSSEAGRVAVPITSLAAHTDDYLLFGGEGEMWVLKGHPAYGGGIDNITLIVGPLGDHAWCRGPRGEFCMLTEDGFYIMPPGQDAFPESVSRERLPDELLDIDVEHYEILLEYDTRARGVHIFVTPVDAKSVFHWFFDWSLKGFHPVAMQSDHEPFALLRYRALVAEDSYVLVGGRDGYIRRFSPRYETDDGTEITSYVEIGPFRLGGSDWHDGILDAVVGTLAANSGDVTASVYVADNHEALQSASEFANTTWSAGRSYTWRPRVRGGSCLIRLENADTDREWALESMVVQITPLATQRL